MFVTAESALNVGNASREPALVEWPRIALVTPVWNSANYLEQTIRSVLAQGYPNLDYFIVDGGSTDGSIDIIRKYEKQFSGWISEPDHGMYDAINKGFVNTSGEIMGWISATDLLHVGGLFVVGSVFREFADVEWVTGRRTGYNESGMTVKIDPLMRWSRFRFLLSRPIRHIQQESTFWRRGLWERAGGFVDANWRYASDFELWVRFFRHAQLHSVDALIGGFRQHSDSGSLLDLAKFNSRCAEIAESELASERNRWIERYRRVDRVIRRIPKLRAIWFKAQSLAMQRVYAFPGADLPPTIEASENGWRRKHSTWKNRQRGIRSC